MGEADGTCLTFRDTRAPQNASPYVHRALSKVL